MNSTPKSLGSASSNGYPYQQLAEEKESIRLFLVQPASSKDDPICCNIIHSTLKECRYDIYEHYVALSYVWGDATQLKTIQVDDLEVTVTANLYSALYDLRHKTKVLRLWADALCINQSDDEEKFNQVALMGSIYQMARVTVIYLGPLNVEIEQLLSGSSEGLCDYPSENKLRIAKSILSLSWFRRVWIFQEFVFSQDPWIQFGRYRWPWESVSSLLEEQKEYLTPDLDSKYMPEGHLGSIMSENPGLVYRSVRDMELARKKI